MRHPRSRVILKGLRENDVDVIECNSASSNRLLDYLRLLKKHQSLGYDFVILGARGDYYGQPLVPVVKRITKNILVFDAVLTLYETNVVDRRLFDERTVKAKFLYSLDYCALHNADIILSDTVAHMNYYSNTYSLNLNKFRRLFVSADDDFFYPRRYKKETDNFYVMFWGGFIPLHGVEYIIRAAKLLGSHKEIRFELRGFGQTYNEVLNLSKSLNAKNITFVPNFVPYEEFPNYVAKADICLGVFGKTMKAQRVMPTKAVEALAMQKPLITGDSPAARELLVNMENSLMVSMANPAALADAILTLKNDRKLREKIAENGYRLFKEKLSPKAIGKELKSVLIKFAETIR